MCVLVCSLRGCREGFYSGLWMCMYVLSMILVYNKEMVERIVFLSRWDIQSLSFEEVRGLFI